MFKNKKIILIIALFLFSIITISVYKINNKPKYDKIKLSYNIQDNCEKSTLCSLYAQSMFEENSLITNDYFHSEQILDEGAYCNSYNIEKKYVNNDFKMIFGIDNEYILKQKHDILSYSYFLKDIAFACEFDIDKNNNFGFTSNSDSSVFSIVKYNYYIDENNYSLSITDKNNDEIVFVKDENLFNKTYLKAYLDYINNKNNNKENYLFGTDENDSAIFPSFNISEKGIISDKNIENYVYQFNVKMNGNEKSYEYISDIASNNIKYNFLENSIIFIIKEDTQYPNIIIIK